MIWGYHYFWKHPFGVLAYSSLLMLWPCSLLLAPENCETGSRYTDTQTTHKATIPTSKNKGTYKSVKRCQMSMFSVPATVTRNSIQPQSHFTSQYMYGEKKRKSPHAVGAVHHRLAHLAEHEVLETERSQKAAHEHDGAHTLLTAEAFVRWARKSGNSWKVQRGTKMP